MKNLIIIIVSVLLGFGLGWYYFDKSQTIENTDQNTIQSDATSLYSIRSNETVTENGKKEGYLLKSTNPEKEIRIDLITSISHPTEGVQGEYLANNPVDLNIDNAVITLPLKDGIYNKFIEELKTEHGQIGGIFNENGDELAFERTKSKGFEGYDLPEAQTIFPFILTLENGIVVDIDLSYRE